MDKMVGSDADLPSDGDTVRAIALSGDRWTLAIGEPWDDIGRVFIHAESLNDTTRKWQTQVSKLVANDYIGDQPRQGSAIALNWDGTIVAVGGSGDDSSTGATWIWEKKNDEGWQQVAKLVGTGAKGKAQQGSALAMNGHENVLAVGGPADDGNIGAVWVFIRSANGTWTQDSVGKLVGTGYKDGIFAGARETRINQGGALAIDSPGTMLAVGGKSDDGNIGAVWIFEKSGNTWTQLGQKLVANDYTEGSQLGVGQGISLAFSGDGTTLAVGGMNDANGMGAVWIWKKNSASAFQQMGGKLVGKGVTGSIAGQGASVDFNVWGNRLVVGGPYDNNKKGAFWTYIYTGSAWKQDGSKVILNSSSPSGFGRTVALSYYTLVVASDATAEDIGGVWYFVSS